MGRLLFILTCGLLLFVGCSRDGGEGEIPSGVVTVLFSAGGLDIETTRTAVLPQGTTLRVVAFKRTSADVPAVVSGTPDHENTYVSAADGSLTPMPDPHDNNAEVGQMRIVTGGTMEVYDFYAYTGALPFTPGATHVAGITHGTDFMAAAKPGVSIGISAQPVVVELDMDHLCSQVNFFAAPSQELKDGREFISLSVDNVVWDGISSSASFTLNPLSDPQMLTVTGNTGRYVMRSFTTAVGVSPDFEVGGSGVILPYPVTAPATTNVIDMTFGLWVNGAEATALAGGVEVPEFRPGHSYTFILMLEPDRITLSLLMNGTDAPDSWSNVTINTEIGQGGVWLALGSWEITSWDSLMGAGGAALTLGKWLEQSWSADMGIPDTYPD